MGKRLPQDPWTGRTVIVNLTNGEALRGVLGPRSDWSLQLIGGVDPITHMTPSSEVDGQPASQASVAGSVAIPLDQILFIQDPG